MMFAEKDWMSLASFMAGMLRAYEVTGQISMDVVKQILEDYEKMFAETTKENK